MKKQIAETVSDIFTGREARLFRSWQWLRSDFAEEFHQLIEAGADREDSGSEIIWNTKRKYTLKITTGTGRVIALKKYWKLRLLPYLYYCTPTTREAQNYLGLRLLGLPMAKLLAVGDTRCFFRPETSFIVTEFATGCQDGRLFCPGGELEADTACRDEFCRRNFELIAKLHDAGYCHRGFTPANELWRKRPEPDADGNRLDIVWIDVASCRRFFPSVLRKKIPDDFVKFLRCFQFEPEEYEVFLQAYCRAVEVKRFTPEELFAEVRRRLAEKTAR